MARNKGNTTFDGLMGNLFKKKEKLLFEGFYSTGLLVGFWWGCVVLVGYVPLLLLDERSPLTSWTGGQL